MTDEDARYGPGQPEQWIGLIPGGGWMVFCSSPDEAWSHPVVAWALTANGDVVSLEADADGHVWPVSMEGGELWHPDSSREQALLRAAAHRAARARPRLKDRPTRPPVSVGTGRYDPSMAHITVRDGRAGHQKDPDGRGAVLGVARAPRLLDVGEVIDLPDGTRGLVIGVEDILGAALEGMDPMSQTVIVGTMPEAPASA